MEHFGVERMDAAAAYRDNKAYAWGLIVVATIKWKVMMEKSDGEDARQYETMYSVRT